MTEQATRTHGRAGIVIVGVSPTGGSTEAVRVAAAEAALRGSELVAVQSWRPPRAPAAPGGRIPPVSLDIDAAFEMARKQLTAQVADALGAYTATRCRLVRGLAASVLLRESAHADLLVVSAPNRQMIVRSPMLVQKLISASTCPVLVVPRSQK